MKDKEHDTRLKEAAQRVGHAVSVVHEAVAGYTADTGLTEAEVAQALREYNEQKAQRLREMEQQHERAVQTIRSAWRRY